ncbi:MAG TPA: hypothetical protein VNN79_09900, partial [Actinomycetota bacterium]|nr:hypothetical protein [Actinomycetota bacterium]
MTTSTDRGRVEGARRVAAVTALAALAVAIVTVVIGVTRNLGLVLGAVVCLAVLGVAGWYVVTRSRGARTAAIVVLAASLAGFVALVLAADADWWRIATGVAAAGVSVAAARVALRPSGEESLMAMVAAASPAERPVLIMNPRSGGGKVERFRLV